MKPSKPFDPEENITVRPVLGARERINEAQFQHACPLCGNAVISPANALLPTTTPCTACRGQSVVAGREVLVVDTKFEKIDWGKVAFRIGLDAKSFGREASEAPDWNQLNKEEVRQLHAMLYAAMRVGLNSDGLTSIREWCEAVLKWADSGRS